MWPWKKKFKPYLVEDKYKIIEAFSLGGTRYLMYDNSFEVPTGRMFAAMAIYVEMEMRCDKEYLEAHTKAMDKLLNPADRKLNITYIAQLNINLRERLELMPLPDFIYKMASVIFFDESESKYSYDFEYNKKKIAAWKKNPDTLDFFLSRLGEELIPSLRSAGKSTSMYMGVAEKINQIHQDTLTKVLSANS
jgi:hypothetical protein